MGSAKSNRTLIGLVGVIALGALFWIAVLSPKRKEADELKVRVTQLQQGLSEAQNRVTEALVAKKAFPSDYRQLIVIGKAVPEGDETPSLLVALSRTAHLSKTSFESLALEAGEATAEATRTAGETGPTGVPTPVPPTEAEAALLPLGAAVGSANLGVMPYSLNFEGGFFGIAKFIAAIESQIKTNQANLAVDGRLITINAFSLTPLEEEESHLQAAFNVNTYVAPPSSGAASPQSSLPPEATAEAGGIQTSPPAAAEAAAGTPSSFETEGAR